MNLARQPRTVTSRAASRGRELVSIAAGRSGVAPAWGDKRFADPAWQGNPLLKRTMQAYLATNTTVDQLFSDAHLDWRDAESIRFVLDVVTEWLSPSNNPLLNPLGYKALIDTGGLSAVRGLRHFVGDMRSAPRVPSMIDPSYLIGDVDEPDPAAWAETAEKSTDSWWPDFVSWLAERGGERKDAPDSPGGPDMPPIEPAPGSYVLEK